MKSAMIPALAPLILLLAGCGNDADYPSLQIRAGETPRTIAEPANAVNDSASAVDRPALQADIRRAEQALQAVRTDLASAERALRHALDQPGARQHGSKAWNEAQLALAGHQDMGGELSAVEALLMALQLQAEGLSADDADQKRIQQLEAGLETLRTDAEALRQQAETRLPR